MLDRQVSREDSVPSFQDLQTSRCIVTACGGTGSDEDVREPGHISGPPRTFLRRGSPWSSAHPGYLPRPLAAVGEGGGVLLVCLVWGVSLVVFTEILSWFSKSERKFYMIYFEDCQQRGSSVGWGVCFLSGTCLPSILQVGESLPVASGAPGRPWPATPPPNPSLSERSPAQRVPVASLQLCCSAQQAMSLFGGICLSPAGPRPSSPGTTWLQTRGTESSPFTPPLPALHPPIPSGSLYPTKCWEPWAQDWERGEGWLVCSGSS